MGNAKRDDNYITTLIAVSNADGITPVTLYADPTTHRLLVSATAGSLNDLSDVVITSAAQGDILYYNGTNWVNLAAGASGKFLKTQGAGANPLWDTPSAGAAGSDTQVQFNDGGSSLGGDAGFTYNKTTDAVSANGGFLPITNDTGALGSALKSFADLFLASGAVINFANGDVVLTHSTGVLTLTTGTLALGANNLTMTGSIGATAARVTKGWFVDAEFTNVPTIGGNALGTIYAAIGQTMYIGTTAVAINRASASLSLAGVNIDGNAGTVTVANEATDTTCYILFATDVSGSLAPKTNTGLTFNSSTGVITLASSVLTTTDINGGTIDGVTIGGAVAGAITGTTITANTGFMPDADDGAYLGQSGTAFSDLFLASGAVINFAAGNATITHSTGLLTLNVPLSLGTSNALTVGTIELGAASDTTISRVSAGVIAVEGVTLLTVAGGTLTGNLVLGENTSVDLDPSLSADGKYTGTAVTGTSGEALAFGDVCTLADTSGKWFKADVSGAVDADSDARNLLGMCVLAAAGADASTKMLLIGVIKADANFPALTVGKPVYASTTGDITQTQPTTTDHVIRIIGYAVPDATSATAPQSIFFNPSNVWTTHT